MTRRDARDRRARTSRAAAADADPIIAIVGRPNVGKSTLFNRLVGRRRRIVRDVPGVTRDRLYGQVAFERWQATVVDTGGFDPSSEEPLIEGVRRQVLTAVDEADSCCSWSTRVRASPRWTPRSPRVLRRSERPVVVVANKVDTGGMESARGRSLPARLRRAGAGVGRARPRRGRDAGDRRATARRATQGAATPHGTVHLAVIGRPNVGKSSLVNAMVGRRAGAGARRRRARPATRSTPPSSATAALRAGRYRGHPAQGEGERGAREAVGGDGAAQPGALPGRAARASTSSEGLTAQDAHIAGYAHEAGRAVVHRRQQVGSGAARAWCAGPR